MHYQDIDLTGGFNTSSAFAIVGDLGVNQLTNFVFKKQEKKLKGRRIKMPSFRLVTLKWVNRQGQNKNINQ